MTVDDFSEDRFLGGRIVAAQPRHGFRAGHDSVLVAAAVPARRGERVLEFGAGAGVASLCLAARVQGCEVLGIEIDARLVALANENARRNGMQEHVHFASGDAGNYTQEVQFDHVFFNPPFHPQTGEASPNSARDLATRDTGDAVRLWMRRALSLLNLDGTATAILRSDRLKDFLDACDNTSAVVLPLLPSVGTAPKRFIVQIRKGRSDPVLRLSGFALHEDGCSTHGAEAVLRHAAALPILNA